MPWIQLVCHRIYPWPRTIQWIKAKAHLTSFSDIIFFSYLFLLKKNKNYSIIQIKINSNYKIHIVVEGRRRNNKEKFVTPTKRKTNKSAFNFKPLRIYNKPNVFKFTINKFNSHWNLYLFHFRSIFLKTKTKMYVSNAKPKTNMKLQLDIDRSI